MMVEKNTWYYKNMVSGAITTNKETKNNWVKSGADVEHIRFSNVYNDFIVFMIEEGKSKV